MEATVHASGVHVSVDVIAAGRYRARAAAPPVATGVDQKADLAGPTRADEAVVEHFRIGRFVEDTVPLIEVGRANGLASDRQVRIGQVRLMKRRVIGGVGDEAIRTGKTGCCSLHDLCVQRNRRGHVAAPRQPAGMADIHVIVNIGNGMELVERVLDGGLVNAAGCRLAAGGRALIGDKIRKAVRLDDVDDPKILVFRIGQRRCDDVDVFGLVALQAGLRQWQESSQT